MDQVSTTRPPWEPRNSSPLGVPTLSRVEFELPEFERPENIQTTANLPHLADAIRLPLPRLIVKSAALCHSLDFCSGSYGRTFVQSRKRPAAAWPRSGAIGRSVRRMYHLRGGFRTPSVGQLSSGYFSAVTSNAGSSRGPAGCAVQMMRLWSSSWLRNADRSAIVDRAVWVPDRPALSDRVTNGCGRPLPIRARRRLGPAPWRRRSSSRSSARSTGVPAARAGRGSSSTSGPRTA